MAFEFAQNLRLYTPEPFILKNLTPAKTPNAWFCQRYPEQFHQFGSPFLELIEHQTICVSINIDFFAACLGGRKDLGHHVVYFEPELAFYFRDTDHIYRTTSSEKLANLYRALMIKCAQGMPNQVHKLNLFHEFRSDKVAKSVVNRAKSILAASSDFFAPTSSHQRIRGPELHERLMRSLCETMLERSEGACLTVTQAYQVFCKLSEQRQLGQLKRSMFKATMQDLVKDRFDVCLRHDVPDSHNKHQQAWKGLKLVTAEALAA